MFRSRSINLKFIKTFEAELNKFNKSDVDPLKVFRIQQLIPGQVYNLTIEAGKKKYVVHLVYLASHLFTIQDIQLES